MWTGKAKFKIFPLNIEPKSTRRIHFSSCFGALTLHYCTFFSRPYFACINIPPCKKSVRIETQNRTDRVLSSSPRRPFIEDTTCLETRVGLYRPHQVTVRQGRPGSSGGSAVLLPFVGAECRAYAVTGDSTATATQKLREVSFCILTIKCSLGSVHWTHPWAWSSDAVWSYLL